MCDCDSVDALLRENERRNGIIFGVFNPVTGEGSVGKRRRVRIEGFALPEQWLPVEMLKVGLVRRLVAAGSVDAFIHSELGVEADARSREAVTDAFVRVRCRYDFAFWAAVFVYIKNKNVGGEPEILFRLSYPQRKFVECLEGERLAGRPIRIALLKARQWGGSTTSQLYMAWLQMCHLKGLNSLIIAHQVAASDEIKDMFDRMIDFYPLSMLHEAGDVYAANEAKTEGVGKSGSITRIPQRNCKIKIGTAERPDSCRGGDYALVHLSEVGLWRSTEGKKPEDIVRSACGGVQYRPLTMIVYESTANGIGNFFHDEYESARKGESQFRPLFIPWYDIDWNRVEFEGDEERRAFAERLLARRNDSNAMSRREESGRYLWWLWSKGATLEAIQWYVMERSKYNSHGQMASECPTDDVEAFVNSGARVFDKYLVEAFKGACSQPSKVGDVYGKGDSGADAFRALRFREDSQGQLWVWSEPDADDGSAEEYISDRYLVVVDIGGRSSKADWSVVVVFDRLGMIDGEPPSVVAQWYGHIDIDLLAWKAGQIASWYDNALLVIESNTLETHDRQRQVDGDQSHYVLNQLAGVYPNLYARRQSEEDIRQGAPRKYGFHTNVATKPMVISNLVKVIREHGYVERDERCLYEFMNYERKQNGSYGAIDGKHDDLLMTRAIGLHVCYNEMESPRVVMRRRGAGVREAGRPVSAATI